jgi:hypothetical protein
MQEVLKFNKGGQWSLEKQAKPPYSSPEGGISTPRQGYAGDNFKAYRSTTGQLREDHDTKGELHGNPNNKRAPKQGLPIKHHGKPASLLPSAAANTNPGLGV